MGGALAMSGAIGERTGQSSTVDMAIAEVVDFGTTPRIWLVRPLLAGRSAILPQKAV